MPETAGRPGAPAAKPEAVVAVLARAGRFLVIRRGPEVIRPGYWTPLSGRVEPGESQPEALVREVREEVGLVALPVAKVWECDTDDGSYRLHWWTAEVTGGELALDPGEVSDARWVLPHEFDLLEPTFDDDRRFFREILPRLPLAR
jgi:8-oxo-dGTP diphosphatase